MAAMLGVHGYLATGVTPTGSTGPAFGQFLKAGIDRWTKVARAGNIKTD